MWRIFSGLIATLIAIPAFAAEPPETEEQKTFYAVGLVMARQLSIFNLAPEELEYVRQGVTDGVTGKTPLRDSEAYALKIQDLAAARREVQGAKLAPDGMNFLERMAREERAVKTKSGLIYLPLQEGTGSGPAATDQVNVHYRGTLINGKEFDSSYARGKPTEVPVVGGIKCWAEGLMMMKPGGKARLICPPDLGYGTRSSGMIPANAILVFDVELLNVNKKFQETMNEAASQEPPPNMAQPR